MIILRRVQTRQELFESRESFQVVKQVWKSSGKVL